VNGKITTAGSKGITVTTRFSILIKLAGGGIGYRETVGLTGVSLGAAGSRRSRGSGDGSRSGRNSFGGN